MNPLQKACALLEAASDIDLARLCGAEKIMLGHQLARWRREMERAEKAPAGVLTDLKRGARAE
jgi:hypothetical protein